MIVSDMVRNPRAWEAWAGPNWDARTLSAEICQRLWNTPVHPSLVPEAWRGLPWKILKKLLVYGYTPAVLAGCLAGCTFSNPEALEWLAACACNRRAGASDWIVWLDNPIRWRFRHLSDEGFKRIMQWESEAA
jgi:hypothetical protein